MSSTVPPCLCLWSFVKAVNSQVAQCCPHCEKLRGWRDWLPCWMFTRAPKICTMFLYWQLQLLLICTHATLFRHSAHIRLWLHSLNKWASLRRYELTGEAVGEMGFMEIWNRHWSLFTLPQDPLKTDLQPINYRCRFCILLNLTGNKLLDLASTHMTKDIFITGSWRAKGDLRSAI